MAQRGGGSVFLPACGADSSAQSQADNPNMVEIVGVEPDLIQLRTRRRGWPSSCNVYVLREGDSAVLIDSGLGVDPSLGELLAALAKALAQWGQTPADVQRILLTHTHSDHAGGAIPIARLTGARILLPVRGWAQAADPWWQVHHILPPQVRRELTANEDIDVALHFRQQTMPELFASASDIDFQLIEDGEEIPVGRYRFKAVHLPGHDVAQLAWIDPQARLAFTGDLLTARGTSLPWYPPNAGGIDAYLDSLDRFSRFELDLACPGHNAVYRGAAAIAERGWTTARTILQRELDLLDALRAGAKPFPELDDLIYEAAVRAVIPWASSVTVAHLQRLERMGLVSRRDDGLYLTEPLAAERHARTLRAEIG